MKVSIAIETWKHKDGTAFTVSVNGENIGTFTEASSDSDAIKEGIKKAKHYIVGNIDDTNDK